MITLRLIEAIDEDYEVIRHFWSAHQWPEVPKSALSGAMGLVAQENGVILAAGWVYTASNGGFAMLEFIVTNPANSPITSAKAVDRLTDFASIECTRRGYQVLFTTCRQKALGRLFERNGFTKTDEEVTHFIKILQPAPVAVEETLLTQ